MQNDKDGSSFQNRQNPQQSRQRQLKVSLINNRSMENKHFIGQSKTDEILGEMEADNVRPVVFNLVQEGLRLQFSLRPTGSGVR